MVSNEITAVELTHFQVFICKCLTCSNYKPLQLLDCVPATSIQNTPERRTPLLFGMLCYHCKQIQPDLYMYLLVISLDLRHKV